ncbi:hypothetical protein MBLNU459_g3643t1 [Dothideomycetes sp. NU459]
MAQQCDGQESPISLPTPFKVRALRRNTPSKQGSESHELPFTKKRSSRPTKASKKDPFAYAPISKQSAELHDRQTFEKIFELHQGVEDGFKLLLQKTEPPLQTSIRGVRSLMSTCLRKIPDYIQAEEDWRKSIDQDDETDVATEVYEELQELSSAPNCGWQPLREVVRAHGIKLVRQIIEDGLVARNTRSELANMPLLYGTSAEAEDLSFAHAHSLIYTRPLNANSPLFEGCLLGLKDLKLFESERSPANARIRIMDSLFYHGKLQSSWIASRDMARMMGNLVRSLASHSGDLDNSIDFIHNRILQACRRSLYATSNPIATEDGLTIISNKWSWNHIARDPTDPSNIKTAFDGHSTISESTIVRAVHSYIVPKHHDPDP